MPLFDYANLVWGDKHNVTLMTSLQVLQNKNVKIILDRLLYSCATHALASLGCVFRDVFMCISVSVVSLSMI